MFDPTVVLYAVAQGWIGHRIVGVGMGFGLITVVVADDHPMFLDALEAAMRGDERLSLVASAVDGVTAVDVVTTLVPDVAVLDVRMGEPDGIDIVAQLRARGVRTRVLLVSAHAEVGIARRALQAGAAGYLVKNKNSRTQCCASQTARLCCAPNCRPGSFRAFGMVMVLRSAWASSRDASTR